MNTESNSSEGQLSACARVLLAIPEEDRHLAALNMQRFVNMVGGRHSDAARSEVARYNRLGRDEYIAQFHADRRVD